MTSMLLAILLLQTPSAGEWSAVTTLTVGSPIRLTLDAGKLEGSILGTTAQSITIRISNTDRTFDRGRVVRVERREKDRSRLKQAGLGFAIGVGAGLVLQRTTCKDEMCMAEATFAYTVPLELTGALIGSALPSARWQTIYVRPGSR